MIQAHLNEHKSLPEGYAIKTKVSEGSISTQALEGGERENVELKGARIYVVREGFKAPDAIWDPNADIATTFTNNLDFFLIHFDLRKVTRTGMAL